jgi:serine protease
VRLWSLLSTGWQFTDYTYRAATTTGSVKAAISSPTPGSTFSSSSVTFSWTSGTGVSQYFLYVGNSVGGNEIYGQSQGTNRSVTVSGIPTDGRTIYVRLWSLLSTGWQFTDYTYRARS